MSVFVASGYKASYVSLVLWLCIVPAGSAQTFEAGLADASWAAQSGPFACSLTHKIPGFGQGVFVRKAGGSETFELRRDKVAFPPGLANVDAVPSSWRMDIDPVSLGQVQAVAGKTPISLTQTRLPALVGGLEKGLRIMFSSNQIADNGSSLRVVLEPRNFTGPYKTYRSCIAGLIPYSFQQLSRSLITYSPNATELGAAAKTQLDKVVRYSKADANVLGIIVDAHSEKLANAEQAEATAKTQAERVTQYLVDKGLPAEKITTRWHGDKFPVASNLTEKGKAQNRRVTVRLENEQTRAITAKKVAALKQKLVDEAAAVEKITSAGAASSLAPATLKHIEKLVEEQDLTSGKQPDITEHFPISP